MSTKRRLTPDDLYKLVFVSDPQVSPDGKRIAYVRTIIDEKTKEYRSQIWITSTCGTAKPRPFTSGPKTDNSPRWSPDGSRLAFVSDRGGDRQIWIMPTAGGEAYQLTKMRRGASNPVWSPDGTKICFTALVDPDDKPEDIQKPMDDKAREEERKKRREEPALVTRIKVKADAAKGLISNGRTHLFVQDVEGKEPAKQITSGDFDHHNPAWSPDGKYIAFSANRREDGDYDPWLVDIFVIPSEGGEARKLTDTKGPSMAPVWTPDGKHIIYAGHKREFGAATLARIWKIPAEGGDAVVLTAGFDRAVGDSMAGDCRFGPSQSGPALSPDGNTVYFLANNSGETALFSVPVEGGEVEQVLGGKRQIFGFTLDKSGYTLAIAVCTPSIPGDIGVFHLDSGEETLLTSENKQLLNEVYLSLPEEYSFKSSDGKHRLGWIMKPVGFKAGQKYPAVLEIHGGPAAMFGWNFFFEFQILAAAGYTVFYTNPRGGQGFGQEFLHAVIGDYGGMDYDDLMTWTDFASDMGFIDKDNMGVTGGSYGGFMTNWIIGHTDRFKAAVTQRSISNWISFYGVSDIGYTFTDTQLLGNPWKDPELLWKHSPLAYVENIRTPLLIIHAEQDMRCPIEQGEQLYITLKKLRKKVEIVRYPDSNHELSRSGKPVLRVHRLKQILRWFDSHLERKPEDYDPPLQQADNS
ncbi:MAG TPA: S9 family peptidase [Firmicutes bacterium]|nr:S9 family peptidase [Bacillota bacterium]